MSSNVGQSHFLFPSADVLTSYLMQHPSSKNLDFGEICPTETLIKATVMYFANKKISKWGIKHEKIENRIVEDLFLQYKDYKQMVSVRLNLATALKDCLQGKKIEELNNKVENVRIEVQHKGNM